MEKINIARLLKDCPKGTKLYTTVWGDVEFIKYCSNLGLIKVSPNSSIDTEKLLYEDGSFSITGECILFPSKENRDWSTFQRPFKDGDIVYVKSNERNEYIIIFKEIKNNHIHKYACFAYRHLSIDKCALCHLVDAEIMRLATEEEKQKLFQAIKDNGYRWNPETKTLEKLIEPKFKVGDRVRSVISSSHYTIVGIKNNQYFIKSDTEEYPYQVSFDHEMNYELVPNKFNIADLRKFESRVLVRTTDDDIWRPAIYGFTDSDKYYVVGGIYWKQCIPYEVNQELLGTRNDCDNFYKTWE